jgi:seryl-tRNA synthetase
METGEKVRLQSNQVKDYYVTQMKTYKEALKMKCLQYKIDFVEADINKGFKQVLLPYLVKRKKMY